MKRYLGHKKGIAILAVLVTLLLVMALVLGLLASSIGERKSARSIQVGVGNERLANAAVNLVISQIRQATAQADQNRTWASQPGMIRSFGQNGEGADSLEQVFKLYSHTKMTVAGGDFDPNGQLPPATWRDQPQRYADVNAPSVNDGKKSYPILHPDVFAMVEGMANLRADQTDVSMPVEWIYQLQDGTLGTLDESGRFTPTNESAQATQPSRDNPITGRMAFWTDDESCKINLNTAGENAFWDLPLGNNVTERGFIYNWGLNILGFASSAPVRGEYYRYPGHPANVSLSTVFQQSFPVNGRRDLTELPPYLGVAAGNDMTEQYGIAPRTSLGGSRAGNRRTDQSKAVTQRYHRLYDSVDEVMLRPDRTMMDQRANPGRKADADFIDRLAFLLSAHSEAPEVNPWGRPRMALWPLSEDKTDRTVTDQLIAHCATVSGKEYFWQRKQNWSAAGAGSSQSASKDWSQLSRNQELYAYLQDSMQRSLPGYGKSFKQKYGADSDQILTSMVDVIRCTNGRTSQGGKSYHYTPPRPPVVNPAARGSGSVVPLKIGSTMGFGRCVTVTEAALVFYAMEGEENRPAQKIGCVLLLETFSPSTGMPAWSPALRYRVSGLDQCRIDGVSLGFPALASTLATAPIESFLGGNTQGFIGMIQPMFTESGQVKQFGQGAESTHYPFVATGVPSDTSKVDMTFTGGVISVEIQSADTGETIQEIKIDLESTQPGKSWPKPMRSDGWYDPAPAGLSYTNFYNRLRADGRVSNLRLRLVRPRDTVRSVEISVDGPTKGDFRLVAATPNVPATWFRKHIDYDLIGATKEELETSGWSEAKLAVGRYAHSLRHSMWSYYGNIGYDLTNSGGWYDVIGNPWRRATIMSGGSLVPNARYFRNCVPLVAHRQNGAYRTDNRYGDWDTGYGSIEDGPYIRKADEANASTIIDGGYFSNTGTYDATGIHGTQDISGLNYTPNRQIVSAIQFGSLPTGIKSVSPWQTLLFCPNPPGRLTEALKEPTESDHPGFGSPPDHMLLDFFWMPVVEPYAISTPFATRGKINMNYEIMPFRDLKRRSGIQAVLKNHMIAALPAVSANPSYDRRYNTYPRYSISYKEGDMGNIEFRWDINTNPVTGTLRGFEERFTKGDIFRSASEICGIYLVPKRRQDLPRGGWNPSAGHQSFYAVGTHFADPPNPEYKDMTKWWNGTSATDPADTMLLTGDNVRESPYNRLYPLLTTKSNTYRVHLIVQQLKKARSGSPGVWDVNEDKVIGEHRESVLIERFLDPNDEEIPDFAANPGTTASLDEHYRFRIVNRSKFYR